MKMDEYFCVKIHYRTAILLLLLIAHRDANTLWLWTEGCNQVTVRGTVHNITDNSPVTCFEACGNGTKSVALQVNRCVCEFDIVHTVWNEECSAPCSGNEITVCGNLENGDWSVYTKANESEVAGKQLPINMTGCVAMEYRGKATYVYTLLSCNDSSASHICHSYDTMYTDCLTYHATSPNWTVACGYNFGQSSLNERYRVGFVDTEKCIEKHGREVDVALKYWTGLIGLESREPSISPTPSDVAGSSTLQKEVPSSIYSTTSPTLIPSYELSSTSLGFVGSENDTNVITNISELLVSVHSDMTELPITHITAEFKSSVFHAKTVDSSVINVTNGAVSDSFSVYDHVFQSSNQDKESITQTNQNRAFSSSVTVDRMYHISTDQFSDKSKATLHQSTSVSKQHSCSVSSCIYSSPTRNIDETQIRTISESTKTLSVSTATSSESTTTSSISTTTSSVSTTTSSVSTTTSSVSVNQYSGKKAQGNPISVSTTVAITAGAVALCALLVVIGMVFYIRKHVTKQPNFGSTNGSEFGRNSEIPLAPFQNNYPPEFQDETSEAVLRSVNMGEDIPNLSYGRRANLHLSNTLSSMHSDVPSMSGRVIGNEYVLY